MKWTINQLNQLARKGLMIDETVDVKDLMELDKSIRNISPVQVTGRADLSSSTKASFHITITGSMILPCSRTLVDVKFPFEIKTTENFLLRETSDYDLESDVDIHQARGEVIDLLPLIKENILLEIPMQIFCDDSNSEDGAPQSGQDWEVITEDDKKNKIDPRLAGLAKFFEDE
ncbi:YceD family protein [Bacillus sp. JJ1562]|uniref:YceD family protein n=1 Tax=Bacillus sp. JJ1562 TaxID=3122960 RepID=UPI003001B665